MSAEILELLTRIAELERKLDSMFRHGPVHERKKIDGRWFIRLKIGGTEREPFLSPWIAYSSANGGPAGLNVHRVPAKGEQLTMLSPAGDFRQAVAVPLFWSNDHPAPSDKAEALVLTHPLFRLEMENGLLTIECESFNLKGRDGSEIAMVDGKLTLKADSSRPTARRVSTKGTSRCTASKITTAAATWRPRAPRASMPDRGSAWPASIARPGGCSTAGRMSCSRY